MGHPQPTTKKSMNQPWTIRKALFWAGGYWQAEDLPDHRLSAEVLLGAVLGLDRPDWVVLRDQSLDDTEWMVFQEKVLRRAEHEPIAYLTGKKEFWSLNFQVDPEVLSPRPETELLVEEAMRIFFSVPGPKILIELGTGSGAVAVALAKSLTHAEARPFLATEISRGALKTARENAASHGVGKKIQWIQGDWLKPFSSRFRWIDVLISNPPYVSEREMHHLPTTVKRFEPLRALFGGQDGLDAVRTILSQAAEQLKIGAWLLLEIGETQGKRILELAEQFHFHPSEILRDYAGKDRVLKAC